MRTAVRRILLLSALMSPGMLQALGLGEIRLNSALNQPFDAEIELVAATQEDLGALRASLASGETFTRYGLDRPSYLSEFSFLVGRGTDGRNVLRISSTRPVTEPFVTLLVEANWPRGRLLREYTVLLDPPVYAPVTSATAAPAPVAAPRVTSGGATSARTAEPVAVEAAPAAPAERPRRETQAGPAATPGIEPGSTYQVRPNDTLWRIASAANPGSRSDINRAMVSIFNQNPQAFDGNINVLRSGSTLSIPSAAELAGVSAAAASIEVSRQYDAWRAGRADAGTTDAATDTSRLRLVPPDQGGAAPSTATPGAAAPATSGNLDARVKQLEAELAEARRLLEVRNAELATLQGGTTAPVESGGAVAVVPEPAPAEEVPVETGTGATTEPAVPPPAAAPAEPAAEPALEPDSGPSLLERVGQYWWALLALLAVIVAALLFTRMRRERGSAEADLEEAMAARDLRNAERAKLTTRPREGGIVVEEKRASEPLRVAPAAVAAAAATTAPRAPEPTRKPVAIDDTISGEGPTSIESGDPLAEADFHMAYGLYDQAADLVQLALKREPNRRDLKLKLLEIYFVWGNSDRFMALAREMNATRNQAPAGEWDKILIMGKQIAPGDPLFAAAPRASADSLDMELHGSGQSLDMDLPIGNEVAPDLDLSAREDVTTERTGIDFMLDEPVRGGGDETSTAPTIETPRVRRDSADQTEELPIESLGLELDTLRAQAALEGGETEELPVESLGLEMDTLRSLDGAARRRGPADDTVENVKISSGGHALDDDDDDEDLVNSTALMKLTDETAAMLRPFEDEPEAGVIDLSDATGELPTIETHDLGELEPTASPSYEISGEPATMSEVGTKLDLARAYMDMGDPEGARSILDEVLQEGNDVQKQEAERLIASLP